MWKIYLAVMVGGGLGSGLRMWISYWSLERFGGAFPWGTLIVNVLGCFIIGAFSELTGPGGAFATPPLVRQVMIIGVLGGFTTFSSFGLQSMHLFLGGNILHGLGNIALSLLLCLGGTWAGISLGAYLHSR
jgi:CrcB protein